MTEATDLTFAARRADDVRLIAGVSAAHFVSHFYILVLPPLFAFVRADYGVSYTELGLALTAFNVVSAVVQTPAGFLVDRINARLRAGRRAAARRGRLRGRRPASNSYWVLVAMFGLIGLGNTVYHPADYALLSRHVAPERMSQAYSIHTFAGMLGSAAAPAAVLLMHALYGWRGAFLGAAALGLVAAAGAAVPARRRDAPAPAQAARSRRRADRTGALLLSAPILINFVFFMLSRSAASACRTSRWWRSARCTARARSPPTPRCRPICCMSALGVLIGGWIAGRITRHRLTASLGLCVTVLAAAF